MCHVAHLALSPPLRPLHAPLSDPCAPPAIPYSRCPIPPPSLDTAAHLCVIFTVSERWPPLGTRHRRREPEGWRRQDHHRPQPRRLPRRGGLARRPSGGAAGAAGGYGPPGQRHQRPRRGQDPAHRDGLRLPARGLARHQRRRADGRREPLARPRHRGPRRRRDRVGRRDGPRDPPADLPGRRRRRLRLRAARQPALTWLAYCQLPHRGRRGADPDPVRVLRPAGPGPAPTDAEPGAADAQPRAGDAGRGADHVRRADPALGGSGGRGAAELPGAGVPSGDPEVGEVV